MKKIIAFLTINIFLFVFNNLEVNAECTYTEKASLNKIAANVKVNYEIDKKTTKLSVWAYRQKIQKQYQLSIYLN